MNKYLSGILGLIILLIPAFTFAQGQSTSDLVMQKLVSATNVVVTKAVYDADFDFNKDGILNSVDPQFLENAGIGGTASQEIKNMVYSKVASLMGLRSNSRVGNSKYMAELDFNSDNIINVADIAMMKTAFPGAIKVNILSPGEYVMQKLMGATNIVIGKHVYDSNFDFNNNGALSTADAAALWDARVGGMVTQELKNLVYSKAANIMSLRSNSRLGNAKYMAQLDFNDDGIINVADINMLKTAFPGALKIAIPSTAETNMRKLVSATQVMIASGVYDADFDFNNDSLLSESDVDTLWNARIGGSATRDQKNEIFTKVSNIFGARNGATEGDAKYFADLDLTVDKIINVADISMMKKSFPGAKQVKIPAISAIAAAGDNATLSSPVPSTVSPEVVMDKLMQASKIIIDKRVYDANFDFNNNGALSAADTAALWDARVGGPDTQEQKNLIYSKAANIMSARSNSRLGDAKYMTELDFNGDQIINVADVLMLKTAFPGAAKVVIPTTAETNMRKLVSATQVMIARGAYDADFDFNNNGTLSAADALVLWNARIGGPSNQAQKNLVYTKVANLMGLRSNSHLGDVKYLADLDLTVDKTINVADVLLMKTLFPGATKITIPPVLTAAVINAFYQDSSETVAVDNENTENISRVSCLSLPIDLQYRDNDTLSGGNVSKLQAFLKDQNYLPSEPTGYFGNETYLAVKAFQLNNGLEDSGYVGGLSRTKIEAVSCK